MQNILNRSCRGVLEHFVWSRALLAFDFDGTLAPIVPVPDHARVRPETARLCQRLARLYPCAVVSSRTPRDLSGRLEGLHAWSTWTGGRRVPVAVRRRIEDWLRTLRDIASRFPGLEIEDKTSRVSLHFRRLRRKKIALAALHRAAARFRDARMLVGKQVLHIQPLEVADKGTAVTDLLRKHRCDTAIYVGDDETDEDVFALDFPGRLLGVRVGRSSSSRAAYYLADQRHVDDLVDLLIQLRSRIGQRALALLPSARTHRADVSRDCAGDADALLGVIRELNHRREVRSRALEQEHGMSAQQCAVLRIIGQFPGIAPGRVSDSLRMDPSGLTPLLKNLVDRGLVDRRVDREDSRRQRLWLTARGRRLDVPLEGSLETAVAQTVARCSADDVAAARRVLEVLVDVTGPAVTDPLRTSARSFPSPSRQEANPCAPRSRSSSRSPPPRSPPTSPSSSRGRSP